MSHCACASGLVPVGETVMPTQPVLPSVPVIAMPLSKKVTVPLICVVPAPVGAIVAVMRLGTFSAGLYGGLYVVVAGRVTDVGLVVADAGVAETAMNPINDAMPKDAAIRARRIPPPFSALPALHEVYGATFC